MRQWLWLTLAAALTAGEPSFITPQEYARQLYHNPRGIGCQHCHGEKGEGRVIAYYEDDEGRKAFRAPRIDTLDFVRFDAALAGRLKGMPKYYLTAEERRALYRYLHPKKETDVPQ